MTTTTVCLQDFTHRGINMPETESTEISNKLALKLRLQLNTKLALCLSKSFTSTPLAVSDIMYLILHLLFLVTATFHAQAISASWEWWHFLAFQMPTFCQTLSLLSSIFIFVSCSFFTAALTKEITEACLEASHFIHASQWHWLSHALKLPV